jgi:hypothetical protein
MSVGEALGYISAFMQSIPGLTTVLVAGLIGMLAIAFLFGVYDRLNRR